MQAVLEIPDEVFGIFEADREPDHLRHDPARAQLVVGELLVRRRGGMDDEGLRVADVGEMTPELERLDEREPGLAPAAQAEREDRTRALR